MAYVHFFVRIFVIVYITDKIMTAISLDKRKKNVIKYIEKINDDSVLNKFEALLKKVSEKPPCQYTVKEVKERMVQGIIDAENGKGTPLDEVRKKYARI